MNLKRLAPIGLILCALAYVGFAVFGDESYSQLESLEHKLSHQRTQNHEVQGEIEQLKKEVYTVQHDERALEKAARNELGMARHGELIFVFDHYIDNAEE